MLNSKPNGNGGKYKNGNYLPENPHKVIKLNKDNGLCYRSSLEYKLYLYLDRNENVITYGAEFIEIPYIIKKENLDGSITSSHHRYYPDVYYELRMNDGSIRKILVEVKPIKQIYEPTIKEKKSYTKKQLKNYKYDVDEYNKNMSKWAFAIDYCERKGIEFKILSDKELDRLLV